MFLTGILQSSIMKRGGRDVYMESSSDSAGSSDAGYSEGDGLDSDAPVLKGKVIKEGFLMKKVIGLDL